MNKALFGVFLIGIVAAAQTPPDQSRQIVRPSQSTAATQPPTPTGRTELVGDDFLHTFTRFAHQKIVAGFDQTCQACDD
jgi:hypothetical protein